MAGAADATGVALDASPAMLEAAWRREIGFDDVDCLWKWREMALLVGVRNRR